MTIICACTHSLTAWPCLAYPPHIYFASINRSRNKNETQTNYSHDKMMAGRFHAMRVVHQTLALICILHSCVTFVNALAVTTKTPIIACASSTEVNRAISFYVQPGDCVLELGAQLTETSSHLCRTIGEGGKAHLVDIKRSDAKSGRCGSRDVTPFIASTTSTTTTGTDSSDDDEQESFVDRVQFEELEQFDQWREVAERSSCQVIILDVGTMIGNDLYLTALSICNELIALSSSSPSPRSVIVKSKTLSSLARRIIHSQRLLDGSVSISQSQLQRTNEPYVIPCVGVNEYRRTIPYILQPGNDVIEVGCHFGRTTTLLNDAVNANSAKGFCVGVDIGPKIVATARKEHPSIPFEVVDAWKTLELLKIKVKHEYEHEHEHDAASKNLGYDVVYADIGGLSGANGLLESLALLDALGNALQPSCIVIKSLCMNRLASQLVAFSNVWNKIHKSSSL